jgi:hydrogenase maturation protein HypF
VASHPQSETYHLQLEGLVQGLGIRPAIARWASHHGLTGNVINTPDGVEVTLCGWPSGIARLRESLLAALPSAAHVSRLEVVLLAAVPRVPVSEAGRAVSAGAGDFAGQKGAAGTSARFVIAESRLDGAGSAAAAVVPPDRRTCDLCLAEVTQPGNRRFGHPFATCTECGPRYSVIASLPFDRRRTSLAAFRMCPICQREYVSAADRRFHAQTLACPECGPQLWFRSETGRPAVSAIENAAQLLGTGGILGLLGVGGYQLLVDATQSAAVQRLRHRKERPAKPLAVMVVNQQMADRWAELSSAEVERLNSPENPIVVARRRAGPTAELPSELTCGLDSLGLMLPSTPLHMLLVRAVGGPLVVTSANREGDPIGYDPQQCSEPLWHLADGWLDHDRQVLRPVDDSVVCFHGSRGVTLRLGRGMAPFRLPLNSPESILAVGGHQKVAVGLSMPDQAVLGAHLGDLDSQATRERFESEIESLCRLYRVQPALVVHDLHPEYASHRWAEQWCMETGANRLAVQHHHAHAVAAQLQAGWLDRDVLGVVWDGSGWGTDGTIWGSEFLLVERVVGVRRLASLRPIPLVGGDVNARQPWRVAVALAFAAIGPAAAVRLRFDGVSTREVTHLIEALQRPRLVRWTTSAGRLFDGLAAILGGIRCGLFEGHPALWLEQLATTGRDLARRESLPTRYRLCAYQEQELWRLDWQPLVAAVLTDYWGGESAELVAHRIHEAVGQAVAQMALRLGHWPVVAAGGCFQNRWLCQAMSEPFCGAARPLALPGAIPPGDGGLAAGQLAIGAAWVARNLGAE